MKPIKNNIKTGRGDSGFTLMQIAAVLVIIGLIIGGVLVGQTLLRQSQIASIMVDVKQYIDATARFQEKYNALPGDMPNATSYWGAATGNNTDNWTATCYGAVAGTGTQTCNGNGDGHIGSVSYNTVMNEIYLYWKHLANAGLIPGHYTGIAWSVVSGYEIYPGVDCPASRVPGGGYTVAWLGNYGGSSLLYAANYGNFISFGAAASGNPTWGNILTTAEAQAFDSKYDDGMPSTGAILSEKPYAVSPLINNCATSATPPLYNTGLSGIQCDLMFITGF